MQFETFELGTDGDESDCVVWDATLESPTLAFLMANMLPPAFPTPLGVLRAVDQPSYEEEVVAQIQYEIDQSGAGELEKLLYSGDIWTVRGNGSPAE